MTQMTKQGLVRWFERAEGTLGMLQDAVEPQRLMQKHLRARGFPETEMNALRAALRVAEAELLNLQQAVYTDLDTSEV